ncbi:hypothetical protein [Paucilactobacillus sp. N302-9]
MKSPFVKKLKYIMLSTLGIIVAIACLLIYINYNLGKNSFYYATHMLTSKNQYPVLREVNRKRLPNKVDQEFPSYINSDEKAGRNGFMRSDGNVSARNVLQDGDKWLLTDNVAVYFPTYKKILMVLKSGWTKIISNQRFIIVTE